MLLAALLRVNKLWTLMAITVVLLQTTKKANSAKYPS